jgi:hypothetical protein
MLEYSYSAIEEALAKTYGASADALRKTAFRARINLFQRLNVLGPDFRVGKGRKIRYRLEQVERWICCLELSELGISPTIAGKLVILAWSSRFDAIFRAAQATVVREPSFDDVVMYLGGVHLMSGNWSAKPENVPYKSVAHIGHCTLKELNIETKRWMADAPFSRLLITNLSARLRLFHEAFSAAQMAELRASKRR